MKSPPGPPMTARQRRGGPRRLIAWCKACGHRVEPDAAAMAERYGGHTTVPEWRERLVCSGCGGRQVDMVVTGTERRQLPWPTSGVGPERGLSLPGPGPPIVSECRPMSSSLV